MPADIAKKAISSDAIQFSTEVPFVRAEWWMNWKVEAMPISSPVLASRKEGVIETETQCATLEEAMQCLDDLIYEGELFEGDPDDPGAGALFVRYGITFTDAGAAEIAGRFAKS